MADDVFPSHSSADKATARAVLEGLENHGIRSPNVRREVERAVSAERTGTHWLDATSVALAPRVPRGAGTG